jgi:hypothetical protein
MNQSQLDSFHKGEQCPYKKICCQEGYCSQCEIWRQYRKVKMSVKLGVDPKDIKTN